VLHVLDGSLEAFLRAAVPLPAQDVDIAFDAPDRDWAAGLTRPTVDLFLWDVRRNASDAEGGLELHAVGEGRPPVRRPPLPRLDCRYLVTAWTSEVKDEHSLLGAVLHTLLVTAELDADFLQGSYAQVRPLPTLTVARSDGKDTADFWSALGGQLKPGLDLVVTATVDAVPAWEAGPPVGSMEVALGSSSPRPYTGGTDRRTWPHTGPHADQPSPPSSPPLPPPPARKRARRRQAT
jgi:hypothetical protein